MEKHLCVVNIKLEHAQVLHDFLIYTVYTLGEITPT